MTDYNTPAQTSSQRGHHPSQWHLSSIEVQAKATARCLLFYSIQSSPKAKEDINQHMRTSKYGGGKNNAVYLVGGCYVTILHIRN